jgi:hypothetical protein
LSVKEVQRQPACATTTEPGAASFATAAKP